MPTPSWSARQLAADIIDRWTKGESPDTQAALTQYPELLADKSVILDLAFAEYWLRLHQGEQIDLETYCRKFPDYHVSLGRLLAQQSLKESAAARKDIEQIDRPTVQVPEAGTPDQPKSSDGIPGSSFGQDWPEAGKHIGDFNLIRAMGKGAFSRVYLAKEETVDRTVVVKLSRQQCDEAKVLGQLGHRNVVSVLSAPHDPSTGLFIIVMPYHGNSTIEDLLELAFPMREESPIRLRPRTASVILDAARRNRQVNDPEPTGLEPDPFLKRASYVDGVIWLGIRMSEALSAVHRSGFVHHDLKPSNVLLGLDGQPRLLDFNLASDARNSKSRLGGTLPYMPPEHLEHLRSATTADQTSMMDQRGDLFSLGVMLYEMVAGVHPFGRFPKSRSVRTVAGDILAKQKLGVRPLRDRNPDVPIRLVRLIEQCLSFDPNGRPPTAADVAMALRKCLSTQKKVSQFFASSTGRSAVIVSSIGLFSALGLMASAFGNPEHVQKINYLESGRSAVQEGRLTDAVTYLNQAAKDDPTNAELHTELARARIAQADFANARQDLVRSLEYRPEDGATIALYAWTLTRLGDMATAETTLRQLAKTNYAPQNVKSLQGYVAVQRRQDTIAEELLREVLSENPDHLVALANLVYLQQLRASMTNQLAGPDTFANVDRLMSLAPADPQMYLWGARFYAWAIARPAGSDAVWHPEPEKMRTKCKEMLRKAIEAGLPQNIWRDDSTFKVLLGEPASYSANWVFPPQTDTSPSYWRSGRPSSY